MDHVLSNALKDREKIVAELRAVDEFIARYKAYAAKLARGSADISTAISPQISDTAPVDNFVHNSGDRPSLVGPSVRRSRAQTKELADLMEHVIRSAGRPLERGDLVGLLEARDVELKSSDKPRYLGTILWRHRDRFRNLPGHGYWMRDEPYQPAKYDPTKDTESERVLDTEGELIDPPLSDDNEDDWVKEFDGSRPTGN